MVNLSSIGSKSVGQAISFKQDNNEEKYPKLLYEEKKKHPIVNGLKIEAIKLKDSFTTHLYKGFSGSKNSNFYEFLNLGTIPYLTGGASMIAVFNAASKYFETPDKVGALKMGKKAGWGVLFYGLFKKASEYLTEVPLNLKYGIDVNLPYIKKIDELPEKRNKKDLTAYEYHKAYESVDFPYWDLFHNSKSYGNDRNSYFKEIGLKMGYDENELNYADQKVKPEIKEKLVQTKAFTSLSSYLWAAVGVSLAMQEPFGNMNINLVSNYSGAKKNIDKKTILKDFGKNSIQNCKNFGKAFIQSCKEFVGSDKYFIKWIVNKCKNETTLGKNAPLAKHIAGRALLGSAIFTTLLGNFIALTDFNKDKGSGKKSIIDDNQEKVVC